MLLMDMVSNHVPTQSNRLYEVEHVGHMHDT